MSRVCWVFMWISSDILPLLLHQYQDCSAPLTVHSLPVPTNTKHLCNVGPTSSTLVQHCTNRPLRYERVYLPLCKVADTPRCFVFAGVDAAVMLEMGQTGKNQGLVRGKDDPGRSLIERHSQTASFPGRTFPECIAAMLYRTYGTPPAYNFTLWIVYMPFVLWLH